jgi:hypothetical protein
MEVVNKVYPNEEQIKGFLEPSAEGPICIETTGLAGQWLEGDSQ